MNIALIGYGKMGHMVEAAALARQHKIVFKADIEGNQQGQLLTAANLAGVEVAVNFSTPDSALLTIDKVTAQGVHMVIGTTGWSEHLPDRKSVV